MPTRQHAIEQVGDAGEQQDDEPRPRSTTAAGMPRRAECAPPRRNRQCPSAGAACSPSGARLASVTFCHPRPPRPAMHHVAAAATPPLFADLDDVRTGSRRRHLPRADIPARRRRFSSEGSPATASSSSSRARSASAGTSRSGEEALAVLKPGACFGEMCRSSTAPSAPLTPSPTRRLRARHHHALRPRTVARLQPRPRRTWCSAPWCGCCRPPARYQRQPSVVPRHVDVLMALDTAVIPCGGLGRRLRPITNWVPRKFSRLDSSPRSTGRSTRPPQRACCASFSS